MRLDVHSGLAFAFLLASIVMLLASLMLVGYANGVADTACRYEQQRLEATDG